MATPLSEVPGALDDTGVGGGTRGTREGEEVEKTGGQVKTAEGASRAL